MNQKSLVVLLLLAIVAAVGAAILFQQRSPSADASGQHQTFLPQLAEQSDQLDQVTIDDLSDEQGPLTLRKSGGQWLVAQQHNYPADFAKLRQLLRQLAAAKTVEAKTSKTENHASLGLSESGTNAGTLIDLGGEGLKFVVGNSAPRRNTSYARKSDEQQTWLLSELIDVSGTANDWLDKSLINISADQVLEVIVDHPEDDLDIALHGDGANFALRDIPVGRELSYPSIGNTVAGALASLSLESVRPSAEFEIPGDAVLTTFKTKDRYSVTVRSWQSDEQSWLSLEAAQDGAATAPEAAEAEGSTADEAAAENSSTPSAAPQVDGAARVVELNQKLGPWVFEVTQLKFDNLRKTHDSLLKPLDTDD